ncbi:MAG TPA: HAMP domain-containing sensor histidine kinase [Vitreimonas sp.]|nr:HAMP domain-containing sensor histidine kinase [Vitreimonas sp.]
MSVSSSTVDSTQLEFLTHLSHQLRTPISSVAWLTELLLAGDIGPLTPEQYDHVLSIYDSNRRLSDVLTHLLHSATLKAGHVLPQPENINLAHLSQQVISEQLQLRGKNTHQHVSEEYETDLPPVPYPEEVVKIIFRHLISNAIKYTPADGQITVKLKSTAADIQWQITDTGYGIPLTQQSQTFTKFFRADNIKAKADGSGMGLYIVKLLVDMIAATIEFHSQENRGSTFTVTFPTHPVVVTERPSL